MAEEQNTNTTGNVPEVKKTNRFRIIGYGLMVLIVLIVVVQIGIADK